MKARLSDCSLPGTGEMVYGLIEVIVVLTSVFGYWHFGAVNGEPA